jgi:flagellar biosynthesis anti-sigma factor FlgM
VKITNYETRSYPVRPDNTVQDSSAVSRRTAAGKQAGASSASVDRVELSAQAREVQQVREIVHAAPEIRTARVAEAKQALANQTLPLQGEALADKLIADTLSTG